MPRLKCFTWFEFHAHLFLAPFSPLLYCSLLSMISFSSSAADCGDRKRCNCDPIFFKWCSKCVKICSELFGKELLSIVRDSLFNQVDMVRCGQLNNWPFHIVSVWLVSLLLIFFYSSRNQLRPSVFTIFRFSVDVNLCFYGQHTSTVLENKDCLTRPH